MAPHAEPGRADRRPLHGPGTALAVLGLAVVLVATLTPVRDARGAALATPLLCLVCGDQGGADVAGNLLLFLPLAIGLRLSGLSWGRTVALCGLLSFTVELLQLRVVPGRDASLSDLLTNTTSGAVGAAIGGWLPRALAPGPRAAAALLGGGTALLLSLLAASAWLLAPRVPEGELLSRWAHEAPGADVFAGRVRSVRLNGLPMPPNGPPPDSAMLRRHLDGGRFTLVVDVMSGAPVPDRSWIYMFRVWSRGALTLNQDRRRAVLAVPSRSLRYRLWPPMLILPNAFPADTGVPVRVTAAEAGRRVRLVSEYGGRERSAALAVSPADGWIMILPVELTSGPWARWITALGLVTAFLPLGLWGRLTGRPGPALAALIAVLAVALGAVPAAAGFPPGHWSQWVAGAAGGAAGWALRAPAAYLEGRCALPSDSEFSSS
jgi:VanZ like family